MDKKNYDVQCAVEAIIDSIASGKLTYSEATRRLGDAADGEAAKPFAEMREDLLKACEELAFILNTDDNYTSDTEDKVERFERRLAQVRGK